MPPAIPSHRPETPRSSPPAPSRRRRRAAPAPLRRTLGGRRAARRAKHGGRLGGRGRPGGRPWRPAFGGTGGSAPLAVHTRRPTPPPPSAPRPSPAPAAPHTPQKHKLDRHAGHQEAHRQAHLRWRRARGIAHAGVGSGQARGGCVRGHGRGPRPPPRPEGWGAGPGRVGWGGGTAGAGLGWQLCAPRPGRDAGRSCGRPCGLAPAPGPSVHGLEQASKRLPATWGRMGGGRPCWARTRVAGTARRR